MEIFNRLPVDIVSEIFTRLPTESVLECKLVSKTWRNLIQHPSFPHMHLRHLNRKPDRGKLSFIALGRRDQKLYYFEYSENHKTPINKITRMKSIFPFKYSVVVGSVKGLICFSDLTSERFCICNPMTKEYAFLPKHKTGYGEYRYWSCGFGYLPSTSEYKVVALNKESNYVEVVVYTLGSGNGWRHVGKFDSEVYDVCYWPDFCSTRTLPSVFLNGALYWLHCKKQMILVFDLAGEHFCEQILIPPALSLERYRIMEIGVLGGYLFCTSYRYNDNHQNIYDIWLYKNQHEEQNQLSGWTNAFRIFDNEYLDSLLDITKSGDILSYSFMHLNIHDPKTSTLQKLVDFKGIYGQVFPHESTLVSLEGLGEKYIKVMGEVKLEKRQKANVHCDEVKPSIQRTNLKFQC